MKIAVAVLLLLGLGAGGWKLYQWRNQPPEIPFVRATRGPIASEVSTNGKVDPIESAEARTESSGRVDRILVKLRQNVTAGDPLVELDTSALRQELKTNAARIQEVRTRLAALDDGGRRPEKVQLQTELDQLQVQRKQAQAEYEKEVRLEAGGVSTRQQVGLRRNEVEKFDSLINGVNKKLSALVDPSDRGPLDAQIKGLESEREATQLRIGQSTVRAPISGTIFKFDLKPGAYLNPGDSIATIGRLDSVHVMVYVDEPDLGRVHTGLPVTITWDALPGRQWMGTVDRLPTHIQPLDSRQVGEVVCIIGNPHLDLIPGANATVRIRTEVVPDAITIPKDAVFHQGTQAGVYVLAGDRLEWRAITQGVNNVAHVQVQELKDGDLVALITTDRTLVSGMQVRALTPKTQ